MKQKDIKPCASCRKGVMHTGLPLFFNVTIQRMGLDTGAIQRQAGLEIMLGGAASLANIMGPDEDIATPISDKAEIMICETCAMKPQLLFAIWSNSLPNDDIE